MGVETCCGCCSLKTGCLVIGILSLVQGAFSFLSSIVQIATGDVNETTGGIHYTSTSVDMRATYAYLLIPTIIQLVVTACFVYGVVKEKKYFILPYLILGMIGIVATVIIIIICAILIHPLFLLVFIPLGLSIYFWIVIWSYYKVLSNTTGVVLQAPPYSVIAMDKDALMNKL